MARAVAFIGPSLRNPAASSNVEFRPPARRGDLLRAVDEGIELIGLIDGILIGDLAISPGELRQSHARGARIIGGASLGAIRAVECPHAIEGVGEVYALFHTGQLTDDDELIGTFDDQYRYIAYPLVTIRDRCADAVQKGLLSPLDSSRAIAIVKELSFSERTIAGIRRALSGRLPPDDIDAIQESLRSPHDDIKARDARVVLSVLESAALDSRDS